MEAVLRHAQGTDLMLRGLICPTLINVTTRPDIDIVFGVKDSNVIGLGLLDTRGCNSNDPKFHSFGVIVKLSMTGFTLKTAVISAVVYPVVAACVAVIVVSPTIPRIRTILPEMSATAVLLLLNVKTAAGLVLLDEGSINENETSRIITRGAIVKLDNVGVTG
jgi:hypothetical protein